MKQSADTKERLLDASEEVFASEGYRAATLRAITARAGVNLAAVNYHYGSKRELLEAVFARRLETMNRARVRDLTLARETARGAGRRPEVRALIAAFFVAALDTSRFGPGERHFSALLMRSWSDTDHTVQRAFDRFMKPTFEALRAAMAEALPALPAAELWWRLQFAIGAMIRVRHLALAVDAGGDQPPQPQGTTVIRMLTDFVDAGLGAKPTASSRRPASAQGDLS